MNSMMHFIATVWHIPAVKTFFLFLETRPEKFVGKFIVRMKVSYAEKVLGFFSRL